MVEEVLLRVAADDLASCRLVCSAWRGAVDSGRFWSKAFARAGLSQPTARYAASMSFPVRRLIYGTGHALGANLIKNGDCDAEAYSGLRNFKFPHWSHVGNEHFNWTAEAVDVSEVPRELLGDTRGTARCFSVPLTYGPNEMHQKFR